MTDFPYRSALIVGTGPGISASLARRLAALGVKVALAARNVQKLHALVEDIGAEAFVQKALAVTAFGGFLVTQQAAETHAAAGAGAILLDGRHGQLQGLCAFGRFCHGQVCAARTCAKRRARTRPQGHPCRALHHRRRGARGRVARTPRTNPTARSTRTPSPKPMSMCCGNLAALGRKKWNCAPGSNASKHSIPYPVSLHPCSVPFANMREVCLNTTVLESPGPWPPPSPSAGMW